MSDESKEVKFFDISEINSLAIHAEQLVRINDYKSEKEGAYIR